jgi:hypothetical protein
MHKACSVCIVRKGSQRRERHLARHYGMFAVDVLQLLVEAAFLQFVLRFNIGIHCGAIVAARPSPHPTPPTTHTPCTVLCCDVYGTYQQCYFHQSVMV